jgi:hypothetical protein
MHLPCEIRLPFFEFSSFFARVLDVCVLEVFYTLVRWTIPIVTLYVVGNSIYLEEAEGYFAQYTASETKTAEI